VLILIPQDRQILEIDSFILSCRVLGRGMETGVLAWVSDHARRCGYSKLVGVFIPTDRNQPAADLYPSQGFTPLSEGGFALDIGESCLTMPDWFEVIQ
jgi:predicted enzyme involved in methoxymalonyl-ACP biosynthesis